MPRWEVDIDIFRLKKKKKIVHYVSITRCRRSTLISLDYFKFVSRIFRRIAICRVCEQPEISRRHSRISSNHYDQYLYLPAVVASRELAVRDACSILRRALFTCILYFYLFKMETFLNTTHPNVQMKTTSKDVNKRSSENTMVVAYRLWFYLQLK